MPASLSRHLGIEGYGLVVFCGLQVASACLPTSRFAGRVRVAVLPLGDEEPNPTPVNLGPVAARTDAFLAATEAEERRLKRALVDPDRIFRTGFLARVDHDSADSEPAGPGMDSPFFILATHSESGEPSSDSLGHSAHLALAQPEVRMIGVRGSVKGRWTPWIRFPKCRTEADRWRWLRRGAAFIDPVPDRSLGAASVAGMLSGIPIVVPEGGGATREHVENSQGGVCYRDCSDLISIIERLAADPAWARKLGSRGRAYAEAAFTDADAFVERVTRVILG